MINYTCYSASKLLELLGKDFHVINKDIQSSFSDWVVGDIETEASNNFYITSMNNIKTITEWSSLWREIVIQLTDNSKLKLHSSNVNSNDESLLRITKNTFLSPSFSIQDNYILSNKELDEWLMYNGISKEQLNSISEIFSVYPTYIYENIHEPIIEDGKIKRYRCSSMKLSEDKIDKAIANIEDVEMRLKIEHILKSFKKYYE